jgi:hypothetical protein
VARSPDLATTELGPLRRLSLKELAVPGMKNVKDLRPLQGMPLEKLDIQDTGVTDLTPLKELKSLRELRCDFMAERDAEVLRSIRTLEMINGEPAAEVLKR